MSKGNDHYLILLHLMYFNVILYNFARNLAQIKILTVFAKNFLSTSQSTSNNLKKVQDVTWRARDVYVIRRVTRFLRRDALNTGPDRVGDYPRPVMEKPRPGPGCLSSWYFQDQFLLNCKILLLVQENPGPGLHRRISMTGRG